MSELFQGGFVFCPYVKMKVSNFSAFRFLILVTPLTRPQENEKNATFSVSKGTSKFGFIAAVHPLCNLSPLEFYLLQPLPSSSSSSAAFKSRASCNSPFWFFCNPIRTGFFLERVSLGGGGCFPPALVKYCEVTLKFDSDNSEI